MITKDKITNLLKAEIGKGREILVAVQYCLTELCQTYKVSDWEERSQILNAILYYAREFSNEDYGYKEFDLVMSRTFPNTETFRNIQEQEGKNIFSD